MTRRQPPLVHVVDDDALSRKHLRTVLAFYGYTVHGADSAAAARLLLLQDGVPDLMLLDLQMPGEDGHALLAWMRRQQQQPALWRLPVIGISASLPHFQEARVCAMGFAQFLHKPITPPERLLGAVRAALGEDAPPCPPGS